MGAYRSSDTLPWRQTLDQTYLLQTNAWSPAPRLSHA